MSDSHVFEAVLMRHGQTEWSVSGQHTGNTDIPLTEAGRVEAGLMRAHIGGHDYELVLTSPLSRARETCELVGLGEAARVREELREWDYGDYEGLTTPQIRELNPEWNLWTDGCPGGETPAQIEARLDEVVEELVAFAATDRGDAIVFAHGHILRCLAARWCGESVELGAHLMLATAAASSLSYEHETRAIKFWNRTSQDR
jgi:probable phosphoglycerate mutase